MILKPPDINKLISQLLKTESTFVLEETHPSLGSIERKQTIEKWRKAYLKQISRNRKESSIRIFNIFTMNLLLRAMRGEKGRDIFREMNKEFRTFGDITKSRVKNVLQRIGYRWGVKNGTEVILRAKEIILKNYRGNWEKYFKEAESKYQENFPEDPFLTIPNVSFKVRDLALSCFSKFYSANDIHVVRVITRTGLLLYGYGDINIGTNPSDKKEYLFLRRLIIKLSKESGYSPGELDRIFWHFGKSVCNARPSCDKCPIKDICLTGIARQNLSYLRKDK